MFVLTRRVYRVWGLGFLPAHGSTQQAVADAKGTLREVGPMLR